MKIFDKDTLTGAVSLGAGAAAAKLVQAKVLPKVMPTANKTITDLAPVAVGLVLPMVIKGRTGRGLADGMIAVGVGSIVEGLLSKAGVAGTMDPVLLGNVDDSSVLMGASEDGGYSDFSSDSYDTSSAFAGEMDF